MVATCERIYEMLQVFKIPLDSCLDVGYENVYSIEWFCDNFVPCFGCEPKQWCLSKTLPKKRQATVFDIPNLFDIVICCNVLENLSDDLAMCNIAKLYQKTKKILICRITIDNRQEFVINNLRDKYFWDNIFRKLALKRDYAMEDFLNTNPALFSDNSQGKYFIIRKTKYNAIKN